MNIRITIGKPFPALVHAGKPVFSHPTRDIVATAQDAAAYLNRFVKQFPKVLMPTGSYTPAEVLAALAGTATLPDFTTTHKSGTKRRKVTVAFDEGKVSPAPIAAY